MAEDYTRNGGDGIQDLAPDPHRPRFARHPPELVEGPAVRESNCEAEAQTGDRPGSRLALRAPASGGFGLDPVRSPVRGAFMRSTLGADRAGAARSLMGRRWR